MPVQSCPITSLRFAHALTDKLKCRGPEFRDYRLGLARGLTTMRGPATVYQEKDIDALWTIKELFQKITGINRDSYGKEMRWETRYEHSLLAAREEWKKRKRR